MISVALTRRTTLTRRVELLDREVTDRLKHPITIRVAHADEALVDKRREDVQITIANTLDRVECRSACENAKPAEQGLLLFVEEIVAPFDRRPQCPLARRRISRCGRKNRSMPLKPLEKCGRGQNLYTSSGE